METIRVFEQTDIERVAAIMQEATADLREVYRPLGTPTRPESGPQTWRKMVFETQGLVIGVIEFALNGKNALIQGLAVDRAHRRRGVARDLIGACEDKARAAGANLLRLSTIKETGNAEIFRSLGFLISNEKISDRFISSDGQAVFQVELQRCIGPAYSLAFRAVCP